MATQRNRKQQTRRSASPLKVSEPGIRNDYRRSSSSGGNLTSILVMCLIVAFILLVAVIYLYNKKGTQPAPIAPVSVTEQKPIIIQPPIATTPPIIVEEAKVEAPAKKPKKKVVPADAADKPVTKKPINLEISGEEKTPAKAKVAEEEPEKKASKPTSDDEPVIPRSFMGGLSNPEMEKNKGEDKDRAKEETRKKKGYELE